MQSIQKVRLLRCRTKAHKSDPVSVNHFGCFLFKNQRKFAIISMGVRVLVSFFVSHTVCCGNCLFGGVFRSGRAVYGAPVAFRSRN